MMLADAEHVEADLVGELDLFHQVAHALRSGQVRRAFDERIDSEFHWAPILVTLRATCDVRRAAYVRRPTCGDVARQRRHVTGYGLARRTLKAVVHRANSPSAIFSAFT